MAAAAAEHYRHNITVCFYSTTIGVRSRVRLCVVGAQVELGSDNDRVFRLPCFRRYVSPLSN
jgi:hypothetical protein